LFPTGNVAGIAVGEWYRDGNLVTNERHVSMNFARLATRVAVGGVSAALATAGLVAATGTSASAAPVTSTYSCVSPFGTFPATVTVDIALLPSTAKAGFPVPAGLLSFNSSFTVDATTAGALNLAGVTGGKSDDFGTAFGATVAKAPVVWNTPSGGPPPTTFSGKGSNAAFVLPQAGVYSVNMPKQFTLQGTNASGGTVATAACTSAAPAQIGTITLSKQVSVTKAKAPKVAHKGDVVPVKGKVTNEFQKTGGPVPTGKVIVKDGKKTVGKGTLKNGKFVVKLKGLKVGAHKLVVTYKGDSYTDKSKSKKLKVVVKP
jgi:hypothetical protein